MVSDLLTQMTERNRELPPRHRGETDRVSFGRMLARWAGVTISIAIFSGLIWYVYTENNTASGPLSIVSADSDSYKKRPDDPGGIEIPNRDKFVYGEAVGRPVEVSESLAPAAERPKAKSEPVIVQISEPEPVQSTASEPDESKRVLGQVPGAKTGASGTKTAPATQTKDSASDSPKTGAKAQPAPLSKPPGAGVSVAALETKAEANVPQPMGKDWSKGFVVQLGAFTSLQRAKNAWDQIRPRFPDIIGDNGASVRQVSPVGKNSIFRLRIGPYATRRDANTVCVMLKARGQDCIVSTPI